MTGPASPVAHFASGPVLVIDYGAQYAQLIARRVREAHVYSEILPHTTPAGAVLARRPAALILSGGPESVYADGAPRVDPVLLSGEVPVLGICYGLQAMAVALGGQVEPAEGSEFGRSEALVDLTSVLFQGQPERQSVWMSHGDAVVRLPAGFRRTASTASAELAAFEDAARRLYAVQWHPEVAHSQYGQRLIENFLYRVAGAQPNWTTGSIIDDAVKAVADQVGTHQVIAGLSGGVDSAVAAALVQRAVGDQLTCVFVDHGLLREGEREQVEQGYVKATGVKLKVVHAERQFLDALSSLADPADPEAKRKAIGREFIRAFEAAAAELAGANGGIRFLVQGTLYPDVVESGGGEGAANIKSHHNVGGLPEDLRFELVEPLRRLFKDEVRAVGEELGLPHEIVWRQPFPGPGLAIRIVGAVTEQRLQILRRADAIVRSELSAAGLDREIWQCPVVLLAEVRSVGVQGDGRTYGHPVVLRPVSSEDAMTADFSRVPYEVLARISTRITNEVREVNRVVLDITSKPPGTIEWE
ncbi:MAG: glutamine-hydrolyzing GMP synthase [Acidimicrobiales bacterium]